MELFGQLMCGGKVSSIVLLPVIYFNKLAQYHVLFRQFTKRC
jgi:hypothetical protein